MTLKTANRLEYLTWQTIRNRCLNPRYKDFARYGGRGIGIAPEWADDFATFFAHVGRRPVGKTILDRIDNRLGYVPGNVRWADGVEQTRNRAVSALYYQIRGRRFPTLSEAAKHFDVTETAVCQWVNGHYSSARGKQYPPRRDCFMVRRYAC